MLRSPFEGQPGGGSRLVEEASSSSQHDAGRAQGNCTPSPSPSFIPAPGGSSSRGMITSAFLTNGSTFSAKVATVCPAEHDIEITPLRQALAAAENAAREEEAESGETTRLLRTLSSRRRGSGEGTMLTGVGPPTVTRPPSGRIASSLPRQGSAGGFGWVTAGRRSFIRVGSTDMGPLSIPSATAGVPPADDALAASIWQASAALAAPPPGSTGGTISPLHLASDLSQHGSAAVQQRLFTLSPSMLTPSLVEPITFPPTEEGYVSQVHWYSFQFAMDELVDELEEAYLAVSIVLDQLPHPIL